MSQRALTLPVRTLPKTRQRPAQWICRRCLATQTMKEPSEAENYDPTLPSSQRDYRLTKTDFHLKKALPHQIPVQYLQHSTSEILHQTEKAQREKTEKHKKMVGVVVSAGKMDKTVKVKVPGQTWNKKIGKYFSLPSQHLVHDPNASLVPGDVVELHRLRVSTAVHHVVANIISPFGTPIEDRPPIPTADERLSMYKEKRFAKLHRRSLRRQAAMGKPAAIRELRSMGLDPGKGVEPLKGETTNMPKATGKGAVLGSKGQKLPEGVLPGGKHEVGKINQRAEQNKSKAMKMERKAEKNILEAKEMEEDTGKKGVTSDSILPKQGPHTKVE